MNRMRRLTVRRQLMSRMGTGPLGLLPPPESRQQQLADGARVR